MSADEQSEHNGPECPACIYEHDWQALGLRKGMERDAHPVCPRCGYQYPVGPDAPDSFDDLCHAPRDLPRYELDRKETRRRMPALDLIENNRIRNATMLLTSQAPPYFWVAPASQSDYHNPVCRETCGLWAHTLMVIPVIERLADSYVDLGKLTRADIDLARSAAILHDQRKAGEYARPYESSTSDHDKEMASVVASQPGLPDRVAGAVEAHMGPWYDGDPPANPLEDLVHTADMVASTQMITPGVPGPVPEELEELGVTEADIDV